jgi:hypothetical protein
MAKRVPEEVIKRMKELKDSFKTLEEVQAIIAKETGVTYSTGTISNRVRRADEKTFRVHLSEKEQQSLKDNYGSVGAGVNAAVKDLAQATAKIQNPLYREAHEALVALSSKLEHKVSWKDMTDVVQLYCDNDYNEAVKVVQALKVEGFITRNGVDWKISNRRAPDPFAVFFKR